MKIQNVSDYDLKIRNDDQFDLLMATTEIGLWEVDVATGNAIRNLRHDQIFGYDKVLSHWSVDVFLDHVIPEDRDRVALAIETALARSARWDFEAGILQPCGAKRFVRASGQPKFDANGVMTKVVGHVIDITEPKERELRLKTLADELNHRVKNTLAVVQGIAKHTFSANDPQTATFLNRLSSLTDVHDILLNTGWSSAELHTIVQNVLRMGPSRAVEVSPTSPSVKLTPAVAVSYAMAFHELWTNAIKYGALSVAVGSVAIDWRISENGEDLMVTWKEREGPVPTPEPTPGFGSVIVKKALETATQGDVKMDFRPTGLVVTIRAPLRIILATEA